jgi:hypothetical protein
VTSASGCPKSSERKTCSRSGGSIASTVDTDGVSARAGLRPNSRDVKISSRLMTALVGRWSDIDPSFLHRIVR